jgi:DNA-binding transcriptional LysR family regulator
MRLSLDALLVVDAIARKGTFAAAAEELHRVPSALTYTIRKLEQDLDVALFDRSGHKAVLTEAGETLLNEGRHLLRAAGELEDRVQRVATGWEARVRIAVADVLPAESIFPLIEAFYQEQAGSTAVQLLVEVYGGCWDALLSGRADLVVGAPAEVPSGGGYATRPLGLMSFDFVVAPDHPLAGAPEPLQPAMILDYRGVTAADSSRSLPPRTSGLLHGQDVLAVPDHRIKLEAHRTGLGVGFLPRYLAAQDVAAGKLVKKEVAEGKPDVPLLLAWRSAHPGKALRWFLKKLEDPVWFAAYFSAEG